MSILNNIKKFFVDDIIVERATIIKDSVNQDIKVWNKHIETKGKIRMLNSSERESGGKIVNFATHRMYCDVLDIKLTDRVKFNNQYYNIVAINNVMNMNEFLEIDLELIQ